MKETRLPTGIETAVVLGSGLGCLAATLEIEARIPFSAVPGMPPVRVPGHAGECVVGRWGSTRVALMCGRAHLYEGHDARALTVGVRWLAACGIRRLVLTNAAGAVNPGFRPGTWMMLSDHLNLTGTSPLDGEAAFVDLSEVYSASWRDQWRWTACQRGCLLHEGVYAGVRGPQYETPAEVRMLRTLGADAVGMSTVLEAIAARASGLEVAGFSCLTNWAAGLNCQPLRHDDVLAAGRAAATSMAELLRAGLS